MMGRSYFWNVTERNISDEENLSGVTECHFKPDQISWLHSPHIILSSSLSHIYYCLSHPNSYLTFTAHSHISRWISPTSASLVILSPLFTSPMVYSWLTDLSPQQTTLSWSQYRYHPRHPWLDWPSPDPSFHHSRGVIRIRVYRRTD